MIGCRGKEQIFYALSSSRFLCILVQTREQSNRERRSRCGSCNAESSGGVYVVSGCVMVVQREHARRSIVGESSALTQPVDLTSLPVLLEMRSLRASMIDQVKPCEMKLLRALTPRPRYSLKNLLILVSFFAFSGGGLSLRRCKKSW